MPLALLSALALLVACQRTEPTPAPSSTPALATGSAAAPQHQPGDRVDVHGIVITFQDGGLIALSGRDKWGNALDTTYENSEFLRKALPVLERSITDEQAAGLRALVGVR